MKSLTGKFASARGWALVLTLFLGAGLFVAACGDEDVPAPTTPAPPPTPTPPPTPPEPAPEPPATPTGLRISASGPDFIEWSWTPVPDVSGYDVQYSTNEAFTDEDEIIARTAEQFMYRREGLAEDTSGYLRVRAAAGTGESRVESGWSTHVTGMTMAAAPETPPAPANLRVTDQGANFIEWQWNAVEGASGYQSEFSTSSDFSDPDDQLHLSASATRRRVPNLAAESAGYLRVRTYTGTLTDGTFGMWTEGSRGSTTEPPPAVALDAPDNVRSTDRSDDSITLEWDRVADAATYEVDQRETGGDWGDASCGAADGDNVVEDEECVASGLDSGTDYDFRVRGIPADDDDAHLTGDWSDIAETRTLGTAPRPTTPSPGGMGDLNIEWTSTGASITFSWDPGAGLQYQWAELAATAMDDADPCEDVTFSAAARQFFHTVDSLSTGDIRGICVRTSDEDNRATSFAWGVVQPAAVADPDQADATLSDVGVTTALAWEGTFVLQGGFDYEFHVVEDRHSIRGTTDASAITSDTAPAAVQRACSAGKLVDRGDADVTVTIDEVLMRSGLTPYTGYLLCFRLANNSGNTEWSVPASNLELYTAPGRPPTPSADNVRSGESDTADSHEVFWNVGLRNNQQVPRAAAGYEAARIVYRQKFVDSSDGDRVKGVPKPRVDACPDTGGTTNTNWTRTAVTTISTTTQGIVIASGDISQPAAPATGSPDLDHTEVKLCLRATYPTDTAGGLDGPWVISSQRVIPQLPPSE